MKPEAISTREEHAKTRTERAEDVAYTINHAISCGTTDMLIAPTISALFGVNVGCSDPTHTHDANCGHDHGPGVQDHTGHKHAIMSKWPIAMPEPAPIAEPLRAVEAQVHTRVPLSWELYRHEAFHYFRSELIGDAAAVPLAIATQRLFPSLMDGIRHVAEPVAAPFFHLGTDAVAKRWGRKQGLAEDAPEVVAYAESMFRSEMKHLPQALMWNVYAFPIGVVAQKMGGHGSSVGRIIRNKTLGAIISNGILLGGRALAPDTAEAIDHWNSTHIIAPVTQTVTTGVGSLLGVDTRGAEAWTKRVQVAPPAIENKTR